MAAARKTYCTEAVNCVKRSMLAEDDAYQDPSIIAPVHKTACSYYEIGYEIRQKMKNGNSLAPAAAPVKIESLTSSTIQRISRSGFATISVTISTPLLIWTPAMILEKSSTSIATLISDRTLAQYVLLWFSTCKIHDIPL